MIKVKDHFTGKYRGAAQSMCNTKFSIPKKTSVVFSGSNCDYHFIMKQLAKEFEGEFSCLRKILKNAKPFQFQ